MIARRDIGNEVIVALAAIGTLALALAFGAILTISRTIANSTPSATPIVTPIGTPIGTGILASFAASNSAASITESATQSATDLAAEQVIATLPATDEINGDATAIATQEVATQAVMPTNTQTLTQTPTPTETAIPSLTLTPVISPTNTPLNPTEQKQTINAIIAPRLTLTMHVALELTGTMKWINDDATAQQVAAGTLTALAWSPTPTDTPDVTPTTAIIYKIVTVTPTPITPMTIPDAIPTVVSVCVGPTGWIPYIVQQGDTLFRISVRAGISLETLQQANCISNSASIYYGQVILVPPGIAFSTPGTMGTPGIMTGANMTACGNPAETITAPQPGSTVHGTISVQGTANIPNFSFYKLEVRSEKNATWQNFAQSTTPVTVGNLGTLNTALFPPGTYWIQLTAIDKTGNYPLLPCAVRVQFAGS